MTAPLYYFYPFAIDGSLSTVPNTTSDGTVSYQDGYGADYSLPIATNPYALPIERTKFNQIMFDVTSNIQQLQQYSVPAFITTAANLGTPFSYNKGVRVLYTDGNIYESLVGSNTALPTVAANWKIVNSAGSQVVWCGTATGTANALTLTPTIPISAYTAGQIFNCTVGTTNTSGTVTINVSGKGSLTLTKSIGLSLVALAQGDLPAGSDISILYDGTNTVLMAPRAYSLGATIAAASTINLDTSTGDYVPLSASGSPSISTITLSVGREVTVAVSGICTFVNGSGLILPNSANIVAAVGDIYTFRGDSSGVVRLVGYCLFNGKSLVNPSQSIIRNYIAGCINSNDVGTPATKIDISSGYLSDSSNTVMMTSAGYTIDFTTTGANGLDTGSIASNTTYFTFIIQKADGTTASLASASLTPSLPSGYLYYRRTLALPPTNGSSQLVSFSQLGDEILLSASVVGFDATNPGTSGTLQTLSGFPIGLKLRANLSIWVRGGTNAFSAYISSPDQNDEVPTSRTATSLTAPGFNVFTEDTGTTNHGFFFLVRTNVAGQIRTRLSASGAADQIGAVVYGYFDTRGKDG